jgi:Flp pilus assembly pilin Flp
MVQFFNAWLGLYADRQDADITDDRQPGQGLVEYALLLLFIAIAVIVALVFFGDRLNALYSKRGNSIPN